MINIFFVLFLFALYFCYCYLLYGAHRDLPVLTHSFPTRRSSDLAGLAKVYPFPSKESPMRLRPAALLAPLVLLTALASPKPGRRKLNPPKQIGRAHVRTTVTNAHLV